MSDTVQIYEHLVKMCEYRGARVIERIDSRDIAEKARSLFNLRIEATREASDIRGAASIIVIYFSAHDGGSSDKISPQISKIMKQYDSNDTSAGITNVIFVTDVIISTQVARNIAEHNARGSNVIIEHHMSNIFMIIAPEHSAVPRHTIVGVRGGRMSADIQKIAREMHVSLFHHLPCLIASTKYNVPIVRPDPIAVWLGMRPGMIIAIERVSENAAGTELVYRRTI
jgi:hypothetical protein